MPVRGPAVAQAPQNHGARSSTWSERERTASSVVFDGQVCGSTALVAVPAPQIADAVVTPRRLHCGAGVYVRDRAG